MLSCRTLTCVALVPESQFYCDTCGGVARAKTDGLLDPKPAKEAKKTASKEDGRGAVPVGQGLARFTSRAETPEERAARLAAEHLGRAEREAKREKLRKERLDARPKKGVNAGVNKYGGDGTSRKARQAHKKRRKQGGIR